MKKELNLNPKILNKTIAKENINRSLKKLSITAILVLIIIYIAVIISNTMIIKKSDIINKKINLNKKVLEENNRLREDIYQKEKFLEKIDIIKKGKKNVSETFLSIDTLTPQDVKFNDISLINKEINILGETINYNSITELLANLQTSKNYSKADLTSITYDKSTNNYNFNIIVKED